MRCGKMVDFTIPHHLNKICDFGMIEKIGQ